MKKFANPDGHKIAYSIRGDGPAMILIHGFGLNSSVWNGILGALSASFRVITMDLPGFGDSESLPSCSIEDIADILAAILHKEGIESGVLIGHSMGGYAGLALAERHPGMLKGLSLCHSHPFADDPEKKEERRKSIKFMERFGQRRFVEQMIPGLFAPGFRDRRPEVVNQYTDQAAKVTVEAYTAGQEAMIVRPDRSAVFCQNQFPVQLIIGEEDGLVPRQQLLDISHLPEIASIHLLEGVGHMGMIESPEVTLNALREFARLCFDQAG